MLIIVSHCLKHYNNFQDEDGCPDFIPQTDSDYDSILDIFDDCKYAVETYNNFEDEDGCPDTLYDQTFTFDSDNDGIVDNVDLCPNIPENYNRFLDTDGCPDDPILLLILIKMVSLIR